MHTKQDLDALRLMADPGADARNRPQDLPAGRARLLQRALIAWLCVLPALMAAGAFAALPASELAGLQPQPAALAAMLAANNGRTELFVYASNRRVYVLDFASLSEQADTLNRIAAYLELAAAPRDRILASSELRQLLKTQHRNWAGLYGGHDYRARDLARFFNQARVQGMPLVPQERALLALLLAQKLLRQDSAGQSQALVPEAALISFVEDGPGLPPSASRRAILSHELRHGMYFTDRDYCSWCHTFWAGLTRPERQGFSAYLVKLGYDTANQDLLINEFQAYLSAGEVLDLALGTRLSPERIKKLKAAFAKRFSP